MEEGGGVMQGRSVLAAAEMGQGGVNTALMMAPPQSDILQDTASRLISSDTYRVRQRVNQPIRHVEKLEL